MIIQKLYIPIINFIYKNITVKFSKKIRNIILLSLCFILSYFYLTREATDFYFIFSEYKRIVLCFIMFFIIIFSIDGEVKKIDINVISSCVYFLAGISMLFFSLLYLDSYKFVLLSTSILVFFPFMYIIWNSRNDWEKLFDYLSISSVIIANFYLLFFYKYAMNGILLNNDYRLVATTTNSNNFSFLILTSFISALYLLMRYGKNYYIYSYLVLLSCMFGFFIYYSQCRALLLFVLVSIFCLLFFIIKIIKGGFNINAKDIAIRSIIIISASIFSYLFMHFLFEVNKVNLSFAIKEITMSERLDNNVGSIKNIYNNSDDLFSIFNTITTNRLGIWVQFFKQMSFFGNPYEHVFVGGVQREAHNVVIDITYRYGYIPGILFAIWYFGTVIKCIKLLFKKDITGCRYFYLILMVFGYFIVSMLDTVSATDRFMLPYCFYIATGILFNKKLYR